MKKKENKTNKNQEKKTVHIQLINLNFSTFVNVVCSYCYKPKKKFIQKQNIISTFLLDTTKCFLLYFLPKSSM